MQTIRQVLRLILLGYVIGVCGLVNLWAHDSGLSAVEGKVRADALELTTGFAPADALRLLSPPTDTPTMWTPQEFEGAKSLLEGIAPNLWEVRAGDQVVAPLETRVELVAGDSVNIRCVYPRPAAGRLTLRAIKLATLPPGHRQFVMISDAQGATLAGKLLSAKDDHMEITLDVVEIRSTPAQVPLHQPEAAGAPAATHRIAPPESLFFEFLRLGVRHIWTGYDHLLFLFALLVVCRSFRSIVAIISCFTLAHSATLALATLNIVNLPSRITEPAIAASILFVGVENILCRGAEPRWRWVLTLAFGLIHGFGFASVLRERGVGAGGQGVAMPLFTFNLGVEIGQIAIASVVLPIIWLLRKNEWFARSGVPVLSALVAAAGLYWFLARTIF
jgi:hydrogenase/urease accessory protein HupE